MSAKLNKGLSELKTVLDKFVSLVVYATGSLPSRHKLNFCFL